MFKPKCVLAVFAVISCYGSLLAQEAHHEEIQLCILACDRLVSGAILEWPLVSKLYLLRSYNFINHGQFHHPISLKPHH